VGSLNPFQGTGKFQNVLLKGLSKSLQQDNANFYTELIPFASRPTRFLNSV
ncbi:uncharacterized protein METZ01_LOCUS414261, partial [marine metagenome]